ncbi:MAG: putative transcriptional regulator, AsnC family [Microbacteriaceae bacterium]|nr:putative transcriptional regulator, AsnC family [Microbacteriaceae bacterium]
MLCSMTALDDTDRRILLALDDDPRATVQLIALNLGLARGTVQARLERLTREKVMRRNSVRLTPTALGYPMRAMVTAEVDQDQFDEMMTDMAEIIEVIECVGLAGENDLMIQIVARDPDHVYDVTRRIKQCRGIKRTATSIVLRELLALRFDHLLGGR